MLTVVTGPCCPPQSSPEPLPLLKVYQQLPFPDAVSTIWHSASDCLVSSSLGPLKWIITFGNRRILEVLLLKWPHHAGPCTNFAPVCLVFKSSFNICRKPRTLQASLTVRRLSSWMTSILSSIRLDDGGPEL
jgi:hypothetical protein